MNIYVYRVSIIHDGMDVIAHASCFTLCLAHLPATQLHNIRNKVLNVLSIRPVQCSDAQVFLRFHVVQRHVPPHEVERSRVVVRSTDAVAAACGLGHWQYGML